MIFDNKSLPLLDKDGRENSEKERDWLIKIDKEKGKKKERVSKVREIERRQRVREVRECEIICSHHLQNWL